MICRQRAVAFGHRGLANVIAGKIFPAVRGSERGKRFARVHLSGRRDRFDPRGAANVRSGVVSTASDRIVEFVNRTGVQRDAQAQFRSQTFFGPIRLSCHLRQRQRELTGAIDSVEHEIQTVAPRVLGDDRFGEFSGQSRNRAKKCSTKRGTSDSVILLKPTASANKIVTMREAKYSDLEEAARSARGFGRDGARPSNFGRLTITGLWPNERQFATTLAAPPGPSPAFPFQTASDTSGLTRRAQAICRFTLAPPDA